ncbi:MAG: FAD:protein FMN transferase [Flavobacteriales bacterium]
MISVGDQVNFSFQKRAVPVSLVFGLFGLLFNACGEGTDQADSGRLGLPELTTHQGDTQGTTYLIKYHGGTVVPQSKIDSVLEAVDVEFNLWRPDSRINAINAYDQSDSLYRFIDENLLWSSLWAQSLDLFEASQGAFDPTVQPLVELWGFGLSKRETVSPEDVAGIMPHVGLTFERIDLNEVEHDRVYQFTTVRKRDAQTGLDFNGIAQGMTVDLLAELLIDHGVVQFMVEVGGEVKCMGERPDGQPWRIAIDQPQADDADGFERTMQTVLEVRNAAVCTSGNYRKFYEEDGVKRSHTISPFTGYPVQHGLLSVTIHATDASTADALATACMVWGPEDGKRFILKYREENPFERIEAYFISDDGTGWQIWETAGWAGLTFVPESA